MSFVDDTRQYNNKNTLSTKIVENIEYDSNIWKRLLSFSGGKQNLAKCAAYIIQWHYSKKGILQMLNNPNIDININFDKKFNK